jgi:hypothetical protein
MDYILVSKKYPKYNIVINNYLPKSIGILKEDFIADRIENAFKVKVENIVDTGKVTVINIIGSSDNIYNIRHTLHDNRDYLVKVFSAGIYICIDYDKKFVDPYHLIGSVYSKIASNAANGKVKYKGK